MKQRKRFLALLLAGAIATGSFTGALAFTEEQVKDSTTEAVNRLEDTAELDRQILFVDDWKFYLGDPSGAEEKTLMIPAGVSVTLPHDWSI
mgnify:FL=1